MNSINCNIFKLIYAEWMRHHCDSSPQKVLLQRGRQQWGMMGGGLLSFWWSKTKCGFSPADKKLVINHFKWIMDIFPLLFFLIQLTAGPHHPFQNRFEKKSKPQPPPPPQTSKQKSALRIKISWFWLGSLIFGPTSWSVFDEQLQSVCPSRVPGWTKWSPRH